MGSHVFMKGDLCRIINTATGDGRYCVIVGCNFSNLGGEYSYEDYNVLLDGNLLNSINAYFLELVQRDDETR